MKQLVGKSLSHVWTTGPWIGSGYTHEFISDSRLRWTGIGGERLGMSDTDQYRRVLIRPGVEQLAWIEHSTGLHKSLTYDFDQRSVFGALFTTDGGVHLIAGRFSSRAEDLGELTR